MFTKKVPGKGAILNKTRQKIKSLILVNKWKKIDFVCEIGYSSQKRINRGEGTNEIQYLFWKVRINMYGTFKKVCGIANIKFE